ncbi:MAG: transketolase C-terminal domain-containing protein [Thermodesulfobacteriota bacterium]
MGLSLLEGNEAVAWGAFEAGCRFFTSYPITPATGIYNTMLRLLPPAGGIVLQAEDEMASMGYCLGAAMSGAKAMTATSGPGLSLYSEHISFAIGSEIPIVIVDVQRVGPSSGAATRGADGDIQFLRWGNSGGMPLIVLAPVDGPDCFTLTIRAFNLAEEFRCPVILASNKEIGMTRESLDLDTLERPPLKERLTAPATRPFLPFEPAPGKDVPYFLPLGHTTLVRQTSATHGEDGYHLIDPGGIARIYARLYRKIESAVEDFSFADTDIQEGADTLLVCYGVTARAARAALKALRAEGQPVSLLILKTLWPVPESLIRAKARAARRVVVVEMNLGQYVREIQRILPDRKIKFLGQMNGALITPAQIRAAIADA